MRIIKEISANITLNQVCYPVVIQYKSNKRCITFRFKEDHFLITAPYGQGKDYLLNQLRTVADRLLKLSNKPTLENEDYIYLLGERYELGPKYINFLNKDYYFKDLNDLKRQLYPWFLYVVEQQVDYYKDLMGITTPYKVKVKELKSKYGSNSRATYTLVFNYCLIHYDLEMLKSVVVHELAHHFEFNHGENFYNIIYKYYPNYNIIDKKLKKGIVK